MDIRMRLILIFFLCLVSNLFAGTIRDSNAWGCRSTEDFNVMVKIANKKDISLFTSHLTSKIQTGDCTFFDEGQSVKILETKYSSGMIKIATYNGVFWTFIEAVR